MIHADKLKTTKKLCCHNGIFSQGRKQIKDEALTGASFPTPHVRTVAGKPFRDGEVIESCNTDVAQVMCPERAELRTAQPFVRRHT
jgi:hypothetical protein